MKTKIIKVDPKNYTKKDFLLATDILNSGGLVAFPTETVYGLGGDGLKEDAAMKIYKAKGRPSDNPLIIHIANMEQLDLLASNVPENAKKLATCFWPGPLTMIFGKSNKVPKETTGGLNTVAVRMPSHPVALSLIENSGICIAAPSANTSGRPSPTSAEHVKEDMEGKIDLIIDSGSVGIGIESTIIDLTSKIPTILRPGYITKKMLEKVIGIIETDPAIMAEKPDPSIIPKAPGMKYKHYAPKGDLTIIEGEAKSVIKKINLIAREKIQEGKKVGIIATDETKEQYLYGTVVTIGSRDQETTIAHGLYRILREFDALNMDIIYSESFDSNELGQAIMNRLLKAAGYQVIQCKNE